MITLYYNGKVRTMNQQAMAAEAFLVEGNKYAFVGSLDQARAYAAENYKNQAVKEVDLGGKLVLPGLSDSHMHFIAYAISKSSVKLAGSESVGEIKDRLRSHLAENPRKEGEWMQGEGWNNDYFVDENRFPNRADLDEVSAEIPIFTTRACIHIASLNSKALELMNINKETASQYGEFVEVGADGEPTGIIKEHMVEAVNKVKSTYDLQGLKDLILMAQEELAEQGLTSIHSDDVANVPDYNYELLIEAFSQLDKEGKLNFRVSEQCRLKNLDQMQEFMTKYPVGWGNKFKVNSIKSFTDGSLGARTALLRAPYADDPSTQGISMLTQEELDAIVETADKHNYPVAVHAIGDGAIELVLNAIEKVRKKNPDKNVRHGIVHCQITDEAMLERIKDLKAITYIQPIFIDYDMNMVESRVGADLAKTSYAWKTMIDKGIPASYGSDCPVESFRTMDTIYTAVARKNITGKEKKVYLPEEAVTMDQAIYAYTMESAYASSEENIKGSIEAGKLADFIVLDKDLYNLASDEEILETKVLQTYVDGKLVYQR